MINNIRQARISESTLLPISLVVVLLAGVGYLKATEQSMRSDIATNTAAIVRVDQRVNNLDNVPTTLAIIQIKIESMDKKMERVEKKLEHR